MASPLPPRSDADRSPKTLDGADARSPVDAGRLGIYTAIGASTGAVPLPWVPGILSRRVRGALVYDVAARHGISLEPAARDALVEPGGPGGASGAVAQAVRFVGVKLAMRTLAAVGPVRLLRPLRAALQTYVLGHLFDRYLCRRSVGSAAPMDACEARRVRAAIDGALARALTVDVGPLAAPVSANDMRDETTVFIDGLLGFAAGVPERLTRRLDTAFDDILADTSTRAAR